MIRGRKICDGKVIATKYFTLVALCKGTLLSLGGGESLYVKSDLKFSEGVLGATRDNKFLVMRKVKNLSAGTDREGN